MAKMLMEYQSGEPIEKVLLVRETQLKTARNGNLYMDMQLADRSGALPAKLWDTSRELFDTVGQDDFVAMNPDDPSTANRHGGFDLDQTVAAGFKMVEFKNRRCQFRFR